jgi:hypothetical protein
MNYDEEIEQLHQWMPPTEREPIIELIMKLKARVEELEDQITVLETQNAIMWATQVIINESC